MSEFDDILVAGLRLRQEQTPDLFFHWNGEDYPCCAGAAGLGKELGLAGFALDADLIVIIILEDLGDTLPRPKQTGFYPNADGAKYRIERTTTPPGSSFIALACYDATKGV